MAVVLLTGASSGLGRSIAHELHRHGHRVYGTSRYPATDQGTTGMLALDVTDDDSVARCVRSIVGAEGRLDVLVNNAGYGLTGALEDTTLSEARDQFDTNFFGALRMNREVLPVMRAQATGRIITVTSMAGRAALPYQPIYSATKFALEGMNEALRMELAGSGIQACTVLPGDFPTGFTTARTLARRAQSTVHGERLARVLQVYERDELGGPDPLMVAQLLARLVEVPRLRVRYIVGRRQQRLGLAAKNWLPAMAFERLMLAVYASGDTTPERSDAAAGATPQCP